MLIIHEVLQSYLRVQPHCRRVCGRQLLWRMLVSGAVEGAGGGGGGGGVVEGYKKWGQAGVAGAGIRKGDGRKGRG